MDTTIAKVLIDSLLTSTVLIDSSTSTVVGTTPFRILHLDPLLRWLHIIAGITWIGLLYFFNFINGHVAATFDADTKKKVVPELMPRTLYWFRWGAAWTWITGLVLLSLITKPM